MAKKLISVVVPTYNEEENVRPLAQAIIDIMDRELPEYDYEIMYIDNHSTDRTRAILREMCSENRKIKAIFNARNFGQMRSPVHGFKQAYGDCVVRLNADFQDPPALIPTLVHEWEQGNKIVIAVKDKTDEGFLMAFIRRQYYKILRKITDIGHIENFTGFGLYDRMFVDIVRSIHDPTPYFRGMVAEFAYDYKIVPYERPQRRAGKSKNNFYKLYDFAMIGITAYSKVVMRLATFMGFLIGGLSFLVSIIYFFFIGLLGEYILAINSRVLDRPLVVEEERLNFDEPKEAQLHDSDKSTDVPVTDSGSGKGLMTSDGEE